MVEIVTPLAVHSYEEQLNLKMEESKKTIDSFSQLENGVRNESVPILLNILPSPITSEYQNKCEFTIGRGVDGSICVGFVGNRIMYEKKCVVVPIDECTIFRENTRRIVHAFEDFVKNSVFPPFNEFRRNGFWKTLTVRDLVGDCMLIFTVLSWRNQEMLKNIKQAIIQRFINLPLQSNSEEFRVTSIYWQTLRNAKDTCVPEHLAGIPYVYEYVLGCTLRISPATFFQTNTHGAEVLYTTIGDMLNLPKTSETNESLNEPLLLVDICCEDRLISLCMMRRLEDAKKIGKFNSKCESIRIEFDGVAMKDAKINIEENGMNPDSCHIICAHGMLFRKFKNCVIKVTKLEDTRVIGILNPPRAGMDDFVIIGCINFIEMKQLIYVTCDPTIRAAKKNLVDLCRPTSNKFEGEPFKITRIQPIDLYPQTQHFEWIVELIR